MSPTESQDDLQKVAFKLPALLATTLRIRAAELQIDIQDAVAQAVAEWRTLDVGQLPTVNTIGAPPFATWLPESLYNDFKEDCKRRGIPFVRGLNQAIETWLDSHPSPRMPRSAHPRRLAVSNQKGGVGKTAVTAGLAEGFTEDKASALAAVAQYLDEMKSRETAPALGPLPLHDYAPQELRVLMVDYDPQGHLTKSFGVNHVPMGPNSLAKHMAKTATGDIRDLIVTVEDGRFGGRLDLLPACLDAFLLDVHISTARNRQATLERALEPLEAHYDVILIDCPPSLGMAMDAAIYYARRRPNEAKGKSGVMVVVQAEDTSADAYSLLISQINDGMADWNIEVEYLGLVVNLYDARDGHIVTSSLQAWRSLGDPRVVGVIPRLKEQREAVRAKRPLLAYDPACEQAQVIRSIVKEIS
ncbi:ParA family protein [Streptomyces sp. NPDC054865]